MILKTKFKKLLSKYLKDFEPYSGEISIPMLAEQLGVNETDIIKIDANENDFIELSWLKEKLHSAIEKIDITRYPDPQSYELRKIIAKHEKVKFENVIMGNGTDDLIDCIIRMFLDDNSKIIVIEPTFSMYRYSASMIGAEYCPVLLNEDFTLNLKKIRDELSNNTKIIILCSPNNPTANQFSIEEIKELLDSTECIVVVDEAYSDFSKYSISRDSNLLQKYDNLIVLKSYSKSWGLAGLRAGFALGNSEIIEYLRSIRKVYNFNSIAQAVLLEMYNDYDYIKSKINEIKKEREWLISQLKKIDGLIVYPSETNFILIRLNTHHKNIKDLIDTFLNKNILIRDRSNLPLLKNCFRITVSKREINLKVLDILKNFLS